MPWHGSSQPDSLTGAENTSLLSEVVPNFNVAPYLFVVQPAGTLSEIVNRLSAAIQIVMAPEEFALTALRQGAVRGYATPAQLAMDMTRETARCSGLIREKKISGE